MECRKIRMRNQVYSQQAGQEDAYHTDLPLLLEAKSKDGANRYCENVQIRDSADYTLRCGDVDASPPATVVACSFLPFRRVESGKLLVHWDALNQEENDTDDVEKNNGDDTRPCHDFGRPIWLKYSEVKRKERAFGKH